MELYIDLLCIVEFIEVILLSVTVVTRKLTLQK